MHNLERFYDDAYAILKGFQPLVLRLELLLIWKYPLASLIFTAAVQLFVGSAVIFQLNKVFMFTSFVSFLILLDLGKNRCWPKIELLISQRTGINFAAEVQTAVDRKEILSMEELAYRLSRSFRLCVSAVNALAPRRRNSPFLFLVATCSIGLACIWLGFAMQERTLFYNLLNVALIYPALRHHAVWEKTWRRLKPIINSIESEFERGQFETQADRDEDERQFWEPIATSPGFTDLEKSVEGFGDSWESTFFRRRTESNGSSFDGDTSEAQFLRDFLPRQIHASTLKNKRAVERITKEMLSENPTQADIDEWFSEVTEEPKPSWSHKSKTSNLQVCDQEDEIPMFTDSVATDELSAMTEFSDDSVSDSYDPDIEHGFVLIESEDHDKS